MDLITYQQQLRTLLVEGKTEQALEDLLQLYQQTGGRFQEEVVVLAGEWQRLEDQQIAGVLDAEEVEQKTNIINYRLVQLISNLDEDKKVAEHFGVPDSSPKGDEKKSKKSILWTAGLVLLGLVAYFFIPREGSQPISDQKRETSQIQSDGSELIALSLNESISGRLKHADQEDVYTVALTQSGRLTIFFDNRSPDLWARMSIYDSRDNRILQHTSPGIGEDFKQTFTAKIDTYRIVVSSYRSDGGSYAVKAELE
ncbi:MAG: hypothetical protein AAGI23_10380 [Bacteroidota bacterium]